jgi:small subunit ribosomal protein S6
LPFRSRITYGEGREQTHGKEESKMNQYEVTFIVQPDLEENGLEELLDKVQGWITTSGGKIEKIERWGKRKLAYSIRKHKEGTYFLLHTEMDPSFCHELERNMQILEPIIRYMVIKKG